jgi:hypothetical protein
MPAVSAKENRLVAEAQKILCSGAPSSAQEIFDAIKGAGLRWSRGLSIADVRKARITVQTSMQEQMRVDEAIGRFQEQAAKLLRSDQEAAGVEVGEEEKDAPDAIEGFVRFDNSPKVESSATLSHVVGDGLREATVRQLAYFLIQAVTTEGKRSTSGGERFNVSVRGPSKTRAKVTDNSNGTYLVAWRPHCSGPYSITVTLGGELLPGSPHLVHVTNSLPCASKCEVSGKALAEAVSRVPQTFEIRFRDRFGQTASAVELDLFVEAVPPNSPRGREVPLTAAQRLLIEQKEAAEAAAAAAAAKGKKGDGKGGQLKGRARLASKEVGTTTTTALVVVPPPKAGVYGASVPPTRREKRVSNESGTTPPVAPQPLPSSPGRTSPVISPVTASAARVEQQQLQARAAGPMGKWLAGPLSEWAYAIDQGPGSADEARDAAVENEPGEIRYRTIRVRVGEKPLILRTAPAKGSAPIGRLLPGQVVTVLEEHISADGEVRACVS